MKKLIDKLPEPIRYWIGITFLAGVLTLLFTWPIETIVLIILTGRIHEHWETFKFIMTISLLSVIGGLIIGFVLSMLFGWGKEIGVLIGFIGSIYVLGCILEEHMRRPYINLWKICKKMFHKCHQHMLMS